MKQETEQMKVIEQYENLISFCNSLPAVSLANNLHKKKVDFLCEQYSEGSKAVQDANAYITMMKKILCKSCDNLCSNYYDNYQHYYRSIEDLKDNLIPIKGSAEMQINSLIQGFMSNVLNPTGLEYIWTRVNADRSQFYAAVHTMFLNFDLNKKLELIVNDVNAALEKKAVELTNALIWKKVALDENQDVNMNELKHPDYSQFKIDMLEVNGQDGTSGVVMDYGQKFMEEYLPTLKMRQKMTEYRKAKVIDKIQEDYSKELKQREQELLSVITKGMQKLTRVIDEYRSASFYQVNGRNAEDIPAEIFRLEQQSTEFKKEDAQCRLLPYITQQGTLATIVSTYAVKFPELLKREDQTIADVMIHSYLDPWKEKTELAISNDITLFNQQNQESEQARVRLQNFLDQSCHSILDVLEITSRIDSFAQIEFGAIQEILDQNLVCEIEKLKQKIVEQMQHIASKNELHQEEQIRIGIKAMNDIAYYKFFEHWSMSLKARVRSMIERKDFSTLPSSMNYEIYLSEMQSYLGMDAKELESIREVLEYRRTGLINLPRYQFLKVSIESNNSNDDLIRQVVKQEITSYLSQFDPVQKEMKEIWDHALGLYINEYGNSVVQEQINPALDKIQNILLEEYHSYVIDEHIRENHNYMDFTKYIHIYGKIDPQILEFILGNDKSFPMKNISYDHWADGTAVTTQNFRDISRNVRERWLRIKARSEG